MLLFYLALDLCFSIPKNIKDLEKAEKQCMQSNLLNLFLDHTFGHSIHQVLSLE